MSKSTTVYIRVYWSYAALKMQKRLSYFKRKAGRY